MTIAIAVVSYRNEDDIAALLESLCKQTWTDFSVYICENGGARAHQVLADRIAGLSGPGQCHAETPRCAAVDAVAATALPTGQTVRTLRGVANHGYAGGVNACIKSIVEDDWSALWIINPDTQPDAAALAALAARQKAGGYGVVGARLLFSDPPVIQGDGGAWRAWMARGKNLNHALPADTPVDAAQIEAQMDYVSGACMLVSRPFIETIGLMREDYFLYCEEVDWCFRRGAFRLGYAGDALIPHDHGSTIGSNRDRRIRSRLAVYLDERNRLLFTRHHYPMRFPFIAAIALALTSQYMMSGAFRNFGHALAGWWAGIRGETGIPPWFTSTSKPAE